jgi:hypothetical protein
MKTLLNKISILTSLVLIVLLATAFLVPCTAAQAAAGDPQCWGVFVGPSTYEYEYSGPWHNDAQGVYDELSPTWGTSHTTLVYPYPTKAEILNSINFLVNNAGPNDTALLFISAIGDSPGYIYAYDSDSSSTAISPGELNDAIDNIHAGKIVVVLQSYSSGGFVTALSGPNRVIITSSGIGEGAWVSSSLGHSYFAKYLLQAFDNFDNADTNHDSQLSAEEIYNYARPLTTNDHSDQHPQISDQYSGDLPLLAKFSFSTTLPGSSGTVATLDGVNFTSSITPRLWVPGGSHTLSVPEVVNSGAGKRYVFTGWNNGEITSSIVVSHGAYTANYKTEYLLTITSPFGNPTGAGWYTSGSNANFSITNYIETSDTKRYFTGWSGDYTGTTSSGSITMNSPKSLTGNWRTEFLLTLNSQYGTPTGAGWYKELATAHISVEPVVGSIIRQIFDGWSGAITSTDANTSVTMNEPKIITSNWHTDYLYLYVIIIVVVVVIVAGAVVTIMLVRRKRPTHLVSPVADTNPPSAYIPPPSITPPPPPPPPPSVAPRTRKRK